MHLGYVTNGFAHHSLPAAIEILAGIGYRSVAITLDHNALNPYGEHFERGAGENGRTADVVTNCNRSSKPARRFLLNSGRKARTHARFAPRGRLVLRRIDFTKRSIDVAATLGSDCVSIWSGVVRHAAGATRAG